MGLGDFITDIGRTDTLSREAKRIGDYGRQIRADKAAEVALENESALAERKIGLEERRVEALESNLDINKAKFNIEKQKFEEEQEAGKRFIPFDHINNTNPILSQSPRLQKRANEYFLANNLIQDKMGVSGVEKKDWDAFLELVKTDRETRQGVYQDAMADAQDRQTQLKRIIDNPGDKEINTKGLKKEEAQELLKRNMQTIEGLIKINDLDFAEEGVEEEKRRAGAGRVGELLDELKEDGFTSNEYRQLEVAATEDGLADMANRFGELAGELETSETSERTAFEIKRDLFLQDIPNATLDEKKKFFGALITDAKSTGIDKLKVAGNRMKTLIDNYHPAFGGSIQVFGEGIFDEIASRPTEMDQFLDALTSKTDAKGEDLTEDQLKQRREDQKLYKAIREIELDFFGVEREEEKVVEDDPIRTWILANQELGVSDDEILNALKEKVKDTSPYIDLLFK